MTDKVISGIIKGRFIKWGAYMYLDKYYKQLDTLEKSERNFSCIYEIMKSRFANEVFGVEFFGGFETKTTYSEFFELCESVAGDLKNRFNQYGSAIAIRMDNSVLWCACFFGVLMAGFKPVLINTRLDEESIKNAVKRTNALCVLCDKETDLDGYIPASSLKSSGINKPRWENEIILMTSGTTGEAKLVVYSGNAITAQVLTTTQIIKDSKSITQNRKVDIKLLALLPFYHIFGLSAVFLWFSFFGRTLIFPTALDSDAIRFACKRGEVTHFFAIPAVWVLAVRGLLAEAKKQGREDIVEVLTQVPRYKARNFREALQFFRILHYALWLEGNYHNTIGRFDKYMHPYLKADMEKGILDKDSALDLVEDFFLSFNKDSDRFSKP